MVSDRRLAVVADADAAALHGLVGRYAWGEGRTFSPGDRDGLSAWEPTTVIALGEAPPPGPWSRISWGVPGERQVSVDGAWRMAPLPASDALVALQSRPGTAVVLAGGDDAARASALEKLLVRGVEAQSVESLTLAALEDAAVVALLGTPGGPMPDPAPAVLAAGRVLVAPDAKPPFGLLAWSDHLPYENEDEMVCAADAAFSFPEAFESIAAVGVLAAEAHLASRVYGRLAIDADLEILGDARRGPVEDPPADNERGDRQPYGHD